jgi:hypothetical protein
MKVSFIAIALSLSLTTSTTLAQSDANTALSPECNECVNSISTAKNYCVETNTNISPRFANYYKCLCDRYKTSVGNCNITAPATSATNDSICPIPDGRFNSTTSTNFSKDVQSNIVGLCTSFSVANSPITCVGALADYEDKLAICYKTAISIPNNSKIDSNVCICETVQPVIKNM